MSRRKIISNPITKNYTSEFAIAIFDISNPKNPIKKSVIPSPTFGRALEIYQNKLFTISYYDDAKVYDINGKFDSLEDVLYDFEGKERIVNAILAKGLNLEFEAVPWKEISRGIQDFSNLVCES